MIEAVRRDRLRVYAVSTIDEGIEVLTGVPAGEPGRAGEYPEGTVNHLVEQRLEALAKKAREFGRSDSEEDSEGQRDD